MGTDSAASYRVVRVLRRGRAPQFFAQDASMGMPGGGVVVKAGVSQSMAERIADRLTRQHENGRATASYPDMASGGEEDGDGE